MLDIFDIHTYLLLRSNIYESSPIYLGCRIYAQRGDRVGPHPSRLSLHRARRRGPAHQQRARQIRPRGAGGRAARRQRHAATALGPHAHHRQALHGRSQGPRHLRAKHVDSRLGKEQSRRDRRQHIHAAQTVQKLKRWTVTFITLLINSSLTFSLCSETETRNLLE